MNESSTYSLPTLYLTIQLGGKCWWAPAIQVSKREPGKKSWGIMIGWLLIAASLYVKHHDLKQEDSDNA